jgi:SAM-dependent methyltransferase
LKISKYFNRPIRNINYYKELGEKFGLEIGGPSIEFSDKGGLPIYKIIGGLDNCTFSANEIWHDEEFENGLTFKFHNNKSIGRQFICEGSNLIDISNETYDFVISCDAIEHFANPLLAMKEHLRVIKPGGFILVGVTDKNDWIDHKRTLTTMEHIIKDFNNNVTEHDLTHMEDAMDNTDTLLIPNLDNQFFITQLQDNYNSRWIHHHTFNISLVVNIFQYLNISILAVDKMPIGHFFLMGRKIYL